MQALQEEMKSGSYISGGPVNYGGSSKVKVDQKAIEEVLYNYTYIMIAFPTLVLVGGTHCA